MNPASQVVAGLFHLWENQDPHFLEVPIENAPSGTDRVLSLKPVGTYGGSDWFVKFADGSEMIRCEFPDGRHADVFLGHPDERELQPAWIIVGEVPSMATSKDPG